MYYVLKLNRLFNIYSSMKDLIKAGKDYKWDFSGEANNLLLTDKNKKYYKYNILKNLILKLVFKEISDISIEGKPQRTYTMIYQN